ncbi:hypothetical protein F5I97DRAFT_1908484 [Phlebopus sp. FC_14]|nr:hypothetical protein F5I97DRAFT_1908484 [Phlebopus sp. FC_14]
MSTHPNHPASMPHTTSAPGPSNPQVPASAPPMPSPTGENPPIGMNMDAAQMQNLLKSLPFLQKNPTEIPPDAAQTLQALTQAGLSGLFSLQAANQHQIPHTTHQLPVPHTTFPAHPPSQVISGIGDPGPSSHPRGPPNLGQLSAVAAAVQAPVVPPDAPAPEGEEAHNEEEEGEKPKPSTTSTSGTGRTRSNRSAAMGTDEWARQRKDNHKEVERRRRGNINEGINELGRIVPNSSGEKAKGAILSRAVQYIHHLKENEARNIEKWTLEKLLMDQAMGDLQAQLEEMRRLWEEERIARQRAESELEVLGGVPQGSTSTVGVATRAAATAPIPPAAPQTNYKARSRSVEREARRNAFGDNEVRTEAESGPGPDVEMDDSDTRPGKRPRVE